MVAELTPEMQEEFVFDGSVEDFRSGVISLAFSLEDVGDMLEEFPTPEWVFEDDRIIRRTRKRKENLQESDVHINATPMAGNRTLLAVTMRSDLGRRNWETLRTGFETRLGYTIQPTAATGDQGGKVTPEVQNDGYAYWAEVFRQANASGNVRRYLEGRNISKSTFYGKVKQHRLK